MTFRAPLLAFACLLPAGAGAVYANAQDPAIPQSVPVKPKTVAKPASSKVAGGKAASAVNANLILIDPGHGGTDKGAALTNNAIEKDVTLALAQKLRTLLTGRGFTVVLTRENSSDEVSQDARVELANRVRPIACVLLHAASGGHGVHLYTSSLTTVTTPDPNAIAPWDTAQLPALAQSTRLLSDLSSALAGIRVPMVTGRASVRPIDSLTCPAVALELAPIQSSGDTSTPVSDELYQQHVAEAVTQALVFWRGHAQSASEAAAGAKPATTPEAPKPKPKPTPKPKPVVIPEEVPADTVPVKPAPIVRRPATPPTGAPE